MREILNGIFYVMRAGCPWRMPPNDLPLWGGFTAGFAVCRDDGRLERINTLEAPTHRSFFRLLRAFLGRIP
jgi:transposase